MADVSIVMDDKLKIASDGKGVKRMRTSRSKSSPAHTHPTYGDMVKRSIVALKEPKGSSRAAILKYIVQNFQVGSNFKMINAHLRLSLKRGVVKGSLKQMKGVGASGSFKLSDSKPKTEVKRVVKTKSTKVVHMPKPKIAIKGTKKLKANEVEKTAKSAKTKKAKTTKNIPKKGKKSVPVKTGVIKLKKVTPKKKAA